MTRPFAYPLPLLILAWLAGPPAQADEAARLAEARQCTTLDSRLERLHCYDALFQGTPAPSADDELPALWQAVLDQEARRDDDAFGLLAGVSGDEVLLTAPALGRVPPRPVLVISCQEWITRFQLHLPEALDAPRVELRLRGDRGDLTQTWRIRGGGHVVSGGRGLPAIDTLRRLLDSETLSLTSEREALDGLRFELGDLREQIQPLRDACRW
ncbi:type VI secretion system-associated protein VasI [Bisbaumannia pacifica]|uniref:Type VI secretion system-associated protein TagO n=1 Tax=Bisbaumannia pacifica TaxID=77098 RepID=A0ABD4L1V7_9GAMM|nr:type VI secretion system-associated protein VasI [Halomonas pacifica]MBH8580705.1 type VI secretion system-associated protein TagO [Halomonas pacifica]